MNGYSRFFRLLRRAGRAGALLLPGLLAFPLAVRAQSARPLVLTSYYDSARTQRCVVYRARRVGADTVAHGTFRRYWPGGSLQELGHFTEGQADSIWTRYYPAGSGQKPALARRLPMRNGKPEGAFTVWYPDGRVGQRGTFRNGQLVDSLVTLKADGQRRLTAQLTESSDGRLQGSFWQRGSRYTALPLQQDLLLYSDADSYSLYPAYDLRRYWTGQLTAGRYTGLLTERDADGQPTIRLSYTAQGRLRLITRYYPAAWRRDALLRDYDEATRRDSVIPAHLFWQWEPLGRPGQFILRHWDLESETPRVQLLQAVPATRQVYDFQSDITGARDQATRLALVSPDLTARLARFTASTLPADCQAARAAYLAGRRPRMVLVKSEPGRWLLGEADTTGATHQPQRRRETQLADGRRQVETVRRTRTYYPDGKLEAVEYRRYLGRQLTRTFHASGTPAWVKRTGLLASYQRQTDPEGRSFNEFTRLLGVRMVKRRGHTRPWFWEGRKSRRLRQRYYPRSR